MILALLLSIPAIALLAVATPRQAGQVFGARLDGRTPVQLRAIGWMLLVGCLWSTLTGEDSARQAIALIAWLGLIAMSTALVLAILPRRQR